MAGGADGATEGRRAGPAPAAYEPAEEPSGGPGVEGGAARAASDTPPARAHRRLVRVVLVLATLLAILAIFAIWANRQLLNPKDWAKTSTALLQKPPIRTAVSAYLVDQLYAHIDVEEQLKSGLPTELHPLAGPLSGALHGVAEQAAQTALATPQVQGVWMSANRAADETLVRIVGGGGHHVQIQGGTVSLNLHQIVTDLSQRLGLPSSLADKLPPSVANIKIVTSKELGLIRTFAKALHALAVLLTVLAITLYGLALFLARGHRRRTLLWVGWSLVSAGLIVLVGRKVAQGQLVSAITSDASIEPAANDAYSVATSLLVQVAGASIIIGIPVIVSAWFAGPARWAVAGRHFLAPHFRDRPSLAYWITAGLLALLFIWGPIPSTRYPLTMLLYAILAFAGTHVLRLQIAEEFPGAEPISLRTAMSQYAHSVGERIGRARAATAPATALGPPSKAAEIERLLALRDRGAITDEEYAAAKRDLFGA